MSMRRIPFGYEIYCNKCYKIIREFDDKYNMLTNQAFIKHKTKKHYCGDCIKKRVKSHIINNKLFDERYIF